ncbi:unnamed protein product [Musa acuminata subsp. burmannicoides]
MHQRGSNDERSSRPDSDLWTKQGRREEANFSSFSGSCGTPFHGSLEMAAIMAIALANGGRKPPDREDFMAPGACRMRRSWYLEKLSASNWEISSRPTLACSRETRRRLISLLSQPNRSVTKNPGDEVYSGSACKQGVRSLGRQHQPRRAFPKGTDIHLKLVHLLHRDRHCHRDRRHVPDPAQGVQGWDR